MPICPTCGRPAAAGARFCPDDGTRLGAPASAELDALLTSPPAGAPPPGRPPASLRVAPVRASARGRSGIVAVVLVGLVGAALVTAYVVSGSGGIEQEAYDAIDRGDLVTPARASAYDLASRIRRDDPQSAALARIGARALGPLVAQADAFYARFYTTSEATGADWSRVSRAMAWAAEIAPTDLHVRARREYADARLAALQGDASEMRAAYERAAAAWPEWALPPNSLGRAFADAGDDRNAEAQYRLATRLDPAWPFPLSNLGALLMRRGRPAAATEALDAAVRADPSRAASHALLARALAASDRYAEAAAEAAEALRIDPAGDAGFDATRLRSDAREWAQIAQDIADDGMDSEEDYSEDGYTEDDSADDYGD